MRPRGLEARLGWGAGRGPGRAALPRLRKRLRQQAERLRWARGAAPRLQAERPGCVSGTSTVAGGSCLVARRPQFHGTAAACCGVLRSGCVTLVTFNK